ncbi:uncharacterized protein [Solanum tuberosum]|uniref:uncharacterized protein n=1 Tax=Solanum tuberosum TaxID=4113 RepID=UPI00073A1C2F|nr:PREDICTED: uncharacterized protein LOC107059121 [Solanum tuberosum]
MNAILSEQTGTTKKEAKNLRNRISYQKIPTEKRVALLALRRAEYSARTHALPQNLAAVHFTKTDSGRQSITPPQSIVFLQNKPLPVTSASQCESIYEIEHEPTRVKCSNLNTLPCSPTVLRKVPNCKFCAARRLQYESPGFCCSNGSIKLVSHRLPPALKSLYFGTNEESNHFRTYIRTYNNMFAFTSLGVKYDKELEKRTQGIYTFKVQGQMHHFINSLLPTNNEVRNLQIYFYDNDADVINKMLFSETLNRSVIAKLVEILKINPYSIFLKSLTSIPNLLDFYIALKCASAMDQRTYNLPTVSEVAGIWVDDESNNAISTPHIRIHTHSNNSQLVHYYYGCYDSLQYPLLFPFGENGWHCGIQKIIQQPSFSRKRSTSNNDGLPAVSNCCSIDGFLNVEEQLLHKQRQKKNRVSCREYYCYKLQIRDTEENTASHSGRLFQQYSVDEFIKVETQRLDFLVFNQDLFRYEVLSGLVDLLRQGERDTSNIGIKTFLPASFTGGPRDMRRRYMDAIALVQQFGKPDIFLTMTCNPSWQEIHDFLLPTDEVQNRPDLITRVFKAKVEELKSDITKKKFFGKIAAFMYTIEFQKCGLPHAHFLIILADNYKLLTPEAYDQLVCAEIPDPATNNVKAVKYIYKYICKGHDKIAFHIHNNDSDIEIDEIKDYRSARWVSPPEAMWRLFGFSISEMTPAVYHLQLHLDGQQFVSFRTSSNLNSVLNNPAIKRTMLTEFFSMNKTNKIATELNLLYKEFPEHFVWSTSNKMWTRRKQGNVVGRVVTCHPTEGERYYLRLLLMNIRGPKSYEDLRTVNGRYYNTFREAAEKNGLLASDNNLIECMSEAANYQMTYSLRHLFATLLAYCNPANPKELWQKFQCPMSEDFQNIPNIQTNDICCSVLNHINDILHSMGHNINEFNLISKTISSTISSNIMQQARDIHLERNITVTNEDLLLHTHLNKEQQKAYNVILSRISLNKSGAFFIDGPGGTGKTYLYRALLATVRSKGFIALATATSGVAASVLPGGRTAHSRFKLPIDTRENCTCNISKQSSLASLIRDAKLIVWDEVSMAKKKLIETFDSFLKDIMNTDTLFGGKVVVFGGDFRQTLPVIQNGKKEDFINESLLNSTIWDHLEKYQLVQNMRARTDPTFSEYLLKSGNGKESVNALRKIEIPPSFLIPYVNEKESLDILFKSIHPNLNMLTEDISSITSRVILTTKNDFVAEINEMFIHKFPGNTMTLVGIDETVEPKDQSQYEDFLHTLNPSGLPPYKLTLKRNSPVILLRNLNPSEGLCNGTRLICLNFKTHVISAKIVSGDFKGKHVFIPRIPLLSSQDEKLPIPFKRTQFPIRLCFAMTINKAQGQTLDFVGIYLREPVFSHGQLYVALSRAKSSDHVKILIRPTIPDSYDDHSTCNIVYNEIIKKAFF